MKFKSLKLHEEELGVNLNIKYKAAFASKCQVISELNEHLDVKKNMK